MTGPDDVLIEQAEVTCGIHEGILIALKEDRVVITAQQRNPALSPRVRVGALHRDAAAAQFRWVVTKLCRDEADAGAATIVVP